MAADIQNETLLEQCDLCSAKFEKPHHIFAQPNLNRLIFKVLQIDPQTLPDGPSYFNKYIAVCSTCTFKIRKYDKQRIELDIMREEIMSSLLDTILHIRPCHNSPLQEVKDYILGAYSRYPEPTTSTVELTQQQKSKLAVDRNKRPPATPYFRKQDFGLPPAQKEIAPEVTGKISKKITNAAVDTAAKTALNVTSDQPDSLNLNANTWLTATTSHLPPETSELGMESWKVGEEVIIYPESELETDQPQTLITTYVSDHILVDHEYVQEYEQFNDEVEPDQSAWVNESGVQVSDDFDTFTNATSNISKDQNQMSNAAEANELSSEASPKIQANVKKSKKKIWRMDRYSETAPQHKKIPFICEGCGRVFSKMQTLRCHIKLLRCKGEEEGIVKKCPICSENFSSFTWREVKDHLDEKHEITKLEKCRFCRKEFLSNTFQNHPCCGVEELPLKPPFKEYKCDYCEDVIYRTSNALTHHIQKKHKIIERPFQCEVCQKCFISDSIRRSHMSIHKMDQTAFTCTHCGISTTTAWSLRQHIKVHTGERPHNCDVCGKTFRLRATLTNHMVVHTKVKNFTCDICGMTFGLYCTMLRHWKLHNNPIPVKGEPCPICSSGSLFKKIKTLREHMIRHHPGTKEQLEIFSRPLTAQQQKELTEYKNEKKISSRKKLKMELMEETDASSNEAASPELLRDEHGRGESMESKAPLAAQRTTNMSTRFGGMKRVVPSKKELGT